MSYQLELRHYRYFKAVADELNFRKAAERLFISQPGLTRQIKLMENTLGAQLFERTKRKVALTSAGYFLLQETEQLLEQQKSIASNIALIAKGDLGELNIGFLGSAIHSVLPPFLISLNEKHRGINATLEEMNNRTQIDQVLKSQLDLGFVRMNRFPKGIRSHPVHTDTFSLVLPASHSINTENFESLAQLKEESFILFSSDYSPQYFDKIVSICEDQGFLPTVSHKSVNAFTIFKLVEQKLGVAIVPSTLKEGYSLNIKFIELTKIPQRTVLSAIWNEANSKAFMPRIIDLLVSL